MLSGLNKDDQFRKTIILVTHDPRAAAYASICHHLDKGVLVQRERIQTRS